MKLEKGHHKLRSVTINLEVSSTLLAILICDLVTLMTTHTTWPEFASSFPVEKI